LPDDHVVPNPEPNPVDDHNGEVVSHPDLAANPDVDANPESVSHPEVDANPDVAPNPDVAANLESDSNYEVDVEEDNAEIDGDDVEEDNANLATNPDGADDDWGEADEVEYVGVDDENEKYKDVLNDDAEADCDYYPDTVPEDDDPLVVDDERDYEGVVHVTDIDNPKIAQGVTFEDGFWFKRCIRQYVVLNEVELEVPYSKSRRYRAYCKPKRCRWRIHASQLPDGKT
jgi:hypothetical protein